MPSKEFLLKSAERKATSGHYTYSTSHPNGFDEITNSVTNTEILKKIVPYGAFLGLDKSVLGQHISKISGKDTGIFNESFEDSNQHKLTRDSDGKLYQKTAGSIQPFDTKDKEHLIVISTTGEIFAFEAIESRGRKFSHASFTTNETGEMQCLFAGMVKAKDGKITSLDLHSGHFRTKPRHLYNAVEKLNRNGFLHEEVQIGVIDALKKDDFSNGRDDILKYHNLQDFLLEHREKSLDKWRKVFRKRATYYGLSDIDTHTEESMHEMQNIRLEVRDKDIEHSFTSSSGYTTGLSSSIGSPSISRIHNIAAMQSPSYSTIKKSPKGSHDYLEGTAFYFDSTDNKRFSDVSYTNRSPFGMGSCDGEYSPSKKIKSDSSSPAFRQENIINQPIRPKIGKSGYTDQHSPIRVWTDVYNPTSPKIFGK